MLLLLFVSLVGSVLEIEPHFLQFDDIIGEGQFGDVYKGTYTTPVSTVIRPTTTFGFLFIQPIFAKLLQVRPRVSQLQVMHGPPVNFGEFQSQTFYGLCAFPVTSQQDQGAKESCAYIADKKVKDWQVLLDIVNTTGN